MPGLKAVLDGQQRLTALNVGLHGSGRWKLPRLWWNNPLAFPERRLYLNLIPPRKENEDELSHKFSLLPEEEANDRNRRNDQEHWYRVGAILDVEDSPDLIDVVHDLGIADRREPQKTLNRLHRVVHSDGIVSAYEEADQNPERVLNIFVRTNSGGTPLSYSDMLLSMAVAQWDKVDARKEIHALVDEINNIGGGFSLNHDFVLRACLMLGDSNSIRFTVEWDHIRSPITETVELASSFGYSRQSLTSANALLPIAYFLYHRRPASGMEDRKGIRDWLIRSLLKHGIWSSGVDNLLAAVRRAIRESSRHDGFPARAIDKAMPSGNLQLLEGSTNTSKGARPPACWLRANYSEDGRRHHCHLHDLGEVPADIEGFLNFYETRRQRILERLRHLLASNSTDSPD